MRIRRFAQFFGRSPEGLGPNEIRQFQMHLLQDGVSADIVRQYTDALRFLYNAVLHRKWVIEKVARPKKARRLPVVLSAQCAAPGPAEARDGDGRRREG